MKIFCVGRNYAAHAAELGNEIPDEPVNRPQILLRHIVKGKPRHWWTKLGRVRDRDPLVFSEVLHLQPEVACIGSSPGAAPANTITGKPVSLGYLASHFSIARRVAIVTTSDLEEIPAPFIALRRR